MFRDRNLMLLATGQFTSRLGDVSFHIGLLWLALEFTGSRQITGFVAMMEYLPILLFGLAAGVLVDRLDRRRVMVLSSLFRALLMLLIPLSAATGHMSIAIFAGCAFALALATSLFTPARDALVPLIVSEDERVRANALVQGSDQFAWFLGPLLAAGFLALTPTHYLFLGSSGLFLISFLLLRMMSGAEPARTQALAHGENTVSAPDGAGDMDAGATRGDAGDYAGTSACGDAESLADASALRNTGSPAGASELGRFTRTSAWREAREGLAFAWRKRDLRWLLILSAVNNFFIMGPAIVAMPIYIGDDLGLPGKYFGAIEAVLALGMMISSYLVVKYPRKKGMGRLWLWGMVLDGLTYTPILLAPTFPKLAPLILLHALFIPLIVIYRISIVQELTPSDMQGRVFSLVSMAVVGMTALSCGVTGLLLGLVPTHILFGTWGILGSLCGITGWLVPSLRRL